MDYVIIVAGGKGLRMGSDMPKQFLPLCGMPVLMHTLRRFATALPGAEIVLALPHDHQALWQQLCRDHHFNLPVTIVDGGVTRFHSIANALTVIPAEADGIVAVHDGVRPLVSTEVIKRCVETARETGAAIPVVPVVETLRHVKGGTVDRNEYRLVQTPQTFDLALHRRAYSQPYDDAFTDDASVVERYGHPVTLVEGNRENIKITTPADLRMAEALLGQNEAQDR